ncbi:hypothetical protein NJC40_20195 [Pseudomonas sp. 21LCFQ02]|uniref:hypothetical protein n=1 Tax=unclassified Pseudomonas TaxID=196821 RepID=UPI00209AB6C5|nr:MULTISPECIES: hypothetical protein [unclassified Pseudomonas]MCO8170086.1 hypothetical protein [Pseudomonas sp. 21LCFQ02]MCQ9426322.1 hypothetical protein [Pseudomonas sp. LJDD11]
MDDIEKNTPNTDKPLATTQEQQTIKRQFIKDPDLLRSLPTISASLKAPQLPNANPEAITLEQANSGVTVLIPGSPQMRKEDVILFYWGNHECYQPLHHNSGDQDVVWLLCLAYPLIDRPQYGTLNLYYEVYRADQLIGTSPVLQVVVEQPTTIG